mmetsp:Transcript_2540/g.3477  ORF Transcript_2540/g.3477 Transcript_2540/m.3477 type:complete len:535 (+) Transcript_2540:105-1709(+)
MFLEVLSVLVAVRLVGAITAPIMDCDETFNYLEPLHYLLFHNGLQPWEYSPAFALRSYSYLAYHAAVLYPLQMIFSADKVSLFYFLRSSLGVLSAICEAYLVVSVRSRFGKTTAWILFLFLGINSGMFHASVSFIPSSLCMYAVTAGYAFWISNRYLSGLAVGAFAVFQWPYVAPMFIPMGFSALYHRGFTKVFVCAILSTLMFLLIPSIFDSYIYGKPVIPVLNQVLYNVVGEGGGGEGANLYGTEPWDYYFRNLILNFQGIFGLSLISPLVILVSREKEKWQMLLFVLPHIIQLGLFTMLEHKEERFVSMIYPMLCLSAALSVSLVWKGINLYVRNSRIAKSIAKVVVISALLVTAVIAISRSFALYKNYRAPQEIFRYVNSMEEKPLSICMEKEWYRFPSSFFLPVSNNDQRDTTKILWLRSKFRGLLPQPFAPWPMGTTTEPTYLNDRNQEDMHAYSKIDDCQYAVDLDLDGENTGGLGSWKQWKKVFCVPFMDSSRSRPVFRSFYLPYNLLENYGFVHYSDYCLLKKIA